MRRVIAYVDGFNLYFGLKDRGWTRYYWLNIKELVTRLLKMNQELAATKYFTARVIGDPGKQKRQATFIEALETLDGFRIFYGKYQLNPRRCPHCGFEDRVPNEKMTDVQIATEMLSDAFANRFDLALLISADSDLVPPVRAIRNMFPEKQVVVAFSPARASIDLAAAASAHFTIGRANLKQSLFPDQVKKEDGFVLNCPPSWKDE